MGHFLLMLSARPKIEKFVQKLYRSVWEDELCAFFIHFKILKTIFYLLSFFHLIQFFRSFLCHTIQCFLSDSTANLGILLDSKYTIAEMLVMSCLEWKYCRRSISISVQLILKACMEKCFFSEKNKKKYSSQVEDTDWLELRQRPTLSLEFSIEILDSCCGYGFFL